MDLAEIKADRGAEYPEHGDGDVIEWLIEEVERQQSTIIQMHNEICRLHEDYGDAIKATEKRLFDALIDTRLDKATAEIERLKSNDRLMHEVNCRLSLEQCDHCVMTVRGPSRLKFDNPPVGNAWCELEDGSGVGRSEALIWREGFAAGTERAALIADDHSDLTWKCAFGAAATDIAMDIRAESGKLGLTS